MTATAASSLAGVTARAFAHRDGLDRGQDASATGRSADSVCRFGVRCGGRVEIDPAGLRATYSPTHETFRAVGRHDPGRPHPGRRRVDRLGDDVGPAHPPGERL